MRNRIKRYLHTCVLQLTCIHGFYIHIRIGTKNEYTKLEDLPKPHNEDVSS